MRQIDGVRGLEAYNESRPCDMSLARLCTLNFCH